MYYYLIKFTEKFFPLWFWLPNYANNLFVYVFIFHINFLYHILKLELLIMIENQYCEPSFADNCSVNSPLTELLN